MCNKNDFFIGDIVEWNSKTILLRDAKTETERACCCMTRTTLQGSSDGNATTFGLVSETRC